MIEYLSGDLLKSDAEAWVNPVNCVGVMGAGLALQFKQAFPDNFTAYKKACAEGKLVEGRAFVFERPRDATPRYIVNFPTKTHWKDPSYLGRIRDTLQALREDVWGFSIRSIAIPMLGCGFGGLAWKDVRPLIEAQAARLPDQRWLIYGPKE